VNERWGWVSKEGLMEELLQGSRPITNPICMYEELAIKCRPEGWGADLSGDWKAGEGDKWRGAVAGGGWETVGREGKCVLYYASCPCLTSHTLYTLGIVIYWK